MCRKKNKLIHLKLVDNSFQPQDLFPNPSSKFFIDKVIEESLPNTSSKGFIDQIIELWEQSHGLLDEYLVFLVGDIIILPISICEKI